MPSRTRGEGGPLVPDSFTKEQRRGLVARAFSPYAPVRERDLFADRIAQVDACVAAVFQRGKHVALYGDRGVGKTSLALMLPKLIQAFGIVDVKGYSVTCSTDDDEISIWRKVFRAIEKPLTPEQELLLEPDLVRTLLERDGRTLLIIFDEFDRMEGESSETARTNLTETIKALSDHSVDTTLMIVGVAETLEHLAGEHASAVRSIEQVPMPRMTDSEIAVTVRKAMDKARVPIADDALVRIVLLSEGLPHYAHLLGQAAALRCVNDDNHGTGVTLEDVRTSMTAALERHSLEHDYDRAISSAQPGTLFERILAACAFVQRDDFGYFRPVHLRESVALVLDRPDIETANFQNHLNEWSDPNRPRYTLHRSGFKYRFKDTLLQPYIKIRALASGLISEDKFIALERLRGRPIGTTSGQGQLF